MEKSVGYYASLPTWSKGVLLVSLIGATVYGIIVVTKAVKSAKENKDLKGDIRDLEHQNNKPTYIDSNYRTFASKIEVAGTGNLFTTDKNAILDVFRMMKTDMDVVLLIKYFGNRYAGVLNWNADLGAFLLAQIGRDGINEVNRILELKSIDYRF